MSNSSPHPYNDLTPECVIDAIESTGRLSDLRILALNSYENRVYQVGSEDDLPIIAKFYRPNRWSDEQILEEHVFTRELADLEIPVLAPLSNSEGDTLFTYNGFRFSLYKRQGGQAPELDNLDHLLIIGRLMGRIHLAGNTTHFQHRPAISLQRYAIDSRQFLLENDFIPSDLLTAYETLSRDLVDSLQARFVTTGLNTQLRLHGDCHAGNILWRDDTPHFVDFDDCCSGPAIQDLWMLLSGDRQQQVQQLSEVIEGYDEFFEFNPAELHLVEPLRTLRMMNYAAWLARRWGDPAFPMAFPWFNSPRYWSDHILSLREQLAALQEPPLQLF